MSRLTVCRRRGRLSPFKNSIPSFILKDFDTLSWHQTTPYSWSLACPVSVLPGWAAGQRGGGECGRYMLTCLSKQPCPYLNHQFNFSDFTFEGFVFLYSLSRKVVCVHLLWDWTLQRAERCWFVFSSIALNVLFFCQTHVAAAVLSCSAPYRSGWKWTWFSSNASVEETLCSLCSKSGKLGGAPWTHVKHAVAATFVNRDLSSDLNPETCLLVLIGFSN